MGQTLVEKIAQRFAVGVPEGHTVRSGDYLSIRPAHVMTHDNTAAVIPKFEKMGATEISDPAQPVFTLDHDIQNTAPENLGKYAKIEAFAKKEGVAFYPAGRGIGHQIMVEEGYVLPGSLVVASDSHSNLYGALGALGTPVVRTDAAAIWATGRTWWQVPDVARVCFSGELQAGVVGKDVIIALCGVFNKDEVLNCCVEFTGPGVAGLSMEERLTISNMTTEWGALAGVFPYDEVTRQYLLARAEHFEERGDQAPRITAELVRKLDADALQADDDALYAKELEFDLAAVTPFISGPNTVKTITALPELEEKDIRIDKAYLMSCVNARVQDFEAAAKVVRGQRVADHVEFYIAAASDEVEREVKQRGLWKTLLDAGAIELPPGCGACIGLGRGTLEAGEVGISATNRNFKGRMGSRDAFVYLSSPAVVAASAIAGRITSPHSLDDKEPRAEPVPMGSGARADARTAGEALQRGSSCRVNKRPPAVAAALQILPGFPKQIEGELLLVPQDNLNTDGIYSKDYTYKEGMTPEQMAAVAMENYDPNFQKIAKEGDILVGGYNFGSGSSREQAATALKYRGIAMIIAGSFSQTYKRNAFNNGYICIECPELVDDLKAAHADDSSATIRVGGVGTVNFSESQIEFRGTQYGFSPLGEIAQELVVKGGFEVVIKEQLSAGN